MIDDVLLGLGFVAVLEGLVLALAPGRIDAMLVALRDIGPDRRRFVGLVSVALGVGLVWAARV